MKKINNFIYIALFFFLITFSVNAENKILSIGSNNAKITVKVFSSLTCPHCANFHKNIFEKLKEEYINQNLVRFEHHRHSLLNCSLFLDLKSRYSRVKYDYTWYNFFFDTVH